MRDSERLTKEAAIHMVPVMQAEGVQYLEQLLDDPVIQTFLEIGTAIGRTSILAAEKGKTVTTIERDEAMIHAARQNIDASACKNQITLIPGDAREVQLEGPYDLIFIDGAKNQYIAYFAKVAPLLSDNGIIITDNMKFHGLVDHPERTQSRHTRRLIRHLLEYRQFLESQSDYVTEFLDDIGDGLAVTRRKKT